MWMQGSWIQSTLNHKTILLRWASNWPAISLIDKKVNLQSLLVYKKYTTIGKPSQGAWKRNEEHIFGFLGFPDTEPTPQTECFSCYSKCSMVYWRTIKSTEIPAWQGKIYQGDVVFSQIQMKCNKLYMMSIICSWHADPQLGVTFWQKVNLKDPLPLW